jgi:hypothetical protein
MEASPGTRARLLTRLVGMAAACGVVAGVWVSWHFGSVAVDTEVGLTEGARSNLLGAAVARVFLAIVTGALACLPVRPWLRSTTLTLALAFGLHGGTALLSLYAPSWGPPLASPAPFAAMAPLAWVGAWLVYSYAGPNRQHRRRRMVGAALLLVAAPAIYLLSLLREGNEYVAWLISLGYR